LRSGKRKMAKYELPEEKFTGCDPIYTDIFTAVRARRAIVKDPPARIMADKALVEALAHLGKEINNDWPTKVNVVHFLYWNFQATIKTAWLQAAFGAVIMENIPPLRVRVSCPDCPTTHDIEIADRRAYESMKANYRCQLCQWLKGQAEMKLRQEAEAKRQQEERERRQQQRKVRKSRKQAQIAEAQGMTYHEYIQSPIWKKTRTRAIRAAGYTCQKCGTKSYELYVHHINHEAVLGDEKLDDLLVLCPTCHKKRYDMKMSRKKQAE